MVRLCRWFRNVKVYRNLLEVTGIYCLKVSDSVDVLIGSQVRLMLMLQGPHFETGLDSHSEILMWV